MIVFFSELSLKSLNTYHLNQNLIVAFASEIVFGYETVILISFFSLHCFSYTFLNILLLLFFCGCSFTILPFI